MTKEQCHNCGIKLTEYEMELWKCNDLDHGYCLKCVKKGDMETDEILKSSNGDY